MIKAESLLRVLESVNEARPWALLSTHQVCEKSIISLERDFVPPVVARDYSVWLITRTRFLILAKS